MYSSYSPSNDILGMMGLSDMKEAAIIILVISLVGALALSIYFLSRKRLAASVGSPVKNWFFRFFNFDMYLSSAIMKFLYIFLTILVICLSFVVMFDAEFEVGLGMLIAGPVVLRLVYEFLLLIFSIRDKLDAIDSKLTGASEKPVRRPEPRHAAPAAAPQAPARRFCNKCGAEVKNGAPFCTNCGAKMG